MDRNLANYLFHNETLYAFEEEVASEVENKKSEVEGQKLESLGKGTDTSRSETSGQATPKPPLSVTEAQNSGKSLSNTPAVPSAYPMKTRYLIVVKNLQVAEKELLSKIMEAIKLKMDIVDLVDVAAYPHIDFKETIYGNMPKAILFFGPESGEEFLVRLKLEKYSPKVLKGINFLMADNLGTILKDQKGEKRMLWSCLKKIFGV